MQLKIIIFQKIIINYVRKEMIKLKEEDKVECPICMDKKSQAITNCKHQNCFNCIKKVNVQCVVVQLLIYLKLFNLNILYYYRL